MFKYYVLYDNGGLEMNLFVVALFLMAVVVAVKSSNND